MPTFVLDKPGLVTIQLDTAEEYRIILACAGAEVVATGTFRAAGTEQKTVAVVVHHQAPQTKAETILRGVATDRSRLKFEGRIIIDPDCGQSQSFLTERIILLSDQATAEAVPDLEILTDDVKCSHAATISHIPQDQLFYLMSRGLNRQQAEELIVEGFLGV